MPSVAAGSRLLLRTPDGLVVLRSLAGASIVGAWGVPVIGDAAALQAGTVLVDIPTDEGLISVLACVAREDTGLVLRPAPEALQVQQQRRDDVRAGLQLTVNAALVSPDLQRVQDLSDDLEIDFSGLSRDVSGGGLGIDLVADDETVRVSPGARLYLEIDLPDGRQVQALIEVISHTRGFLRGIFVDVARVDRDLLVGLVFTRQRLESARRATETDEA